RSCTSDTSSHGSSFSIPRPSHSCTPARQAPPASCSRRPVSCSDPNPRTQTSPLHSWSGNPVSRPAGASPLDEDHADPQAKPCPISATTSEEHFAMPLPLCHRHPFHETQGVDCPISRQRTAESERRTPSSDQQEHLHPFFFSPSSLGAFQDPRARHIS